MPVPQIVCVDPTSYFTYEIMSPMSEFERLTYMRDKYCEAAVCFHQAAEEADNEDIRLELQSIAENHQASCYNLNQAMVAYDDGIAVEPIFFYTTRMGDFADDLSKNTRRSTPLGTIYSEMDGYQNAIDVNDIPEEDILDEDEYDIEDPTYDIINYREHSEGVEDTFSTDHTTCLNDIPCTYDKLTPLNTKSIISPTEDIELDDIDFDPTIDVKELTSGCANGTGYFDKMMTAIDSNIDMQFKNNRLDANTFNKYYAEALQTTLQQAVALVIKDKQFELDKARLELEYKEKGITEERIKYEVGLAKALEQEAKARVELTLMQIKELDLRVQERVDKIPLEMSILTQEAKNSEKQVELTSRQIENTLASTKKIYRDRVEAKLDGRINRNFTEAKIENTRVSTQTAKFETILTKEKILATKSTTLEAKHNNASMRRVSDADVQVKVQQALLTQQQAKGYTQQHRENILKIGRDIWGQQVENGGLENMVVEAVKGSELSSRMERAFIDAGI